MPADSGNVSIIKPLPPITKETEYVFRRTIEQNFEQVALRIDQIRDQEDRDSFLAQAATDFLTMGAPGRKP